MFNLLHYKNAAFPAVAIETCEEDRFMRNVLSIKDTPVFSIAAVGGLRDSRTGEIIDERMQFPGAFQFIEKQSGAILIVFDFQAVIRNPGAYRSLKMAFGDLKDRQCMIALVAPSWSLPAELQHDIPVLSFDLPTRAQLERALQVVVDGAEIMIDRGEVESLLDAAAGLSLQEAENAFALSLVQDKRLLPATIEAEKMRLIRASGGLEVSQAVNPASIGGLDNLKSYVRDEVMPKKNDPLLRVKGILCVGIPGSGKSLFAKSAGAMLGWPVVRMDIGSLKGSLVGQSEANLNNALKLIDAIAPAVLWVDEIEKAVGGYASSAQSDSGVTLGMVGKLLTWLQEHTSAVLTVATCNDYSKLPSELTRAGRFDERFFVDLPSASERIEIARVHLQRFIGEPDGLCEIVSDITDSWTGAEIEQLIKSAARRCDNINADILKECAKDIRPISRVKADEINNLRSWAKGALRIANSMDIKSDAEKHRRLTV